MKYLSIVAVLLFGVFTSNSTYAQNKIASDTIKVWGNCGMCKTTIEKSAKAAGAKTAVWNEDSKDLIVSYAAAKTSSNKIQEAVANAGYDTQDLTAPVEVYNKLHGCCQYERKEAVASAACCKDTACGTAGDTCKGKACCKDEACAKKM